MASCCWSFRNTMWWCVFEVVSGGATACHCSCIVQQQVEDDVKILWRESFTNRGKPFHPASVQKTTTCIQLASLQNLQIMPHFPPSISSNLLFWEKNKQTQEPQMLTPQLNHWICYIFQWGPHVNGSNNEPAMNNSNMSLFSFHCLHSAPPFIRCSASSKRPWAVRLSASSSKHCSPGRQHCHHNRPLEALACIACGCWGLLLWSSLSSSSSLLPSSSSSLLWLLLVTCNHSRT